MRQTVRVVLRVALLLVILPKPLEKNFAGSCDMNAKGGAIGLLNAVRN